MWRSQGAGVPLVTAVAVRLRGGGRRAIQRRMRIAPLGLAMLCLLAAAPYAGAADTVFDGRVSCVDTQGVRFCQGDVTHRVETWDGIPLDANVTLPPASVSPPYPLIIEEHGWSLGKSDSPFTPLALAGYAVLSYSARGFYQSCGKVASRAPDASLSDPNACARGWTHLGDARYEIRDSQHLAGLLADDGWVIPDKIAVRRTRHG